MQADMPSLSEETKLRLSQSVNQAIFEPIGRAFTTAQANHQIRNVQPKLSRLCALCTGASLIHSKVCF